MISCTRRIPAVAYALFIFKREPPRHMKCVSLQPTFFLFNEFLKYFQFLVFLWESTFPPLRNKYKQPFQTCWHLNTKQNNANFICYYEHPASVVLIFRKSISRNVVYNWSNFSRAFLFFQVFPSRFWPEMTLALGNKRSHSRSGTLFQKYNSADCSCEVFENSLLLQSKWLETPTEIYT